MRRYEDTEIWRKCVWIRGEILQMCDECDWDDVVIADYRRTVDVLCDSIRSAFGAVDKDGVSVCLIVAGGKIGRLTGFLEVGVLLTDLEKERGVRVLWELFEVMGMIDRMIDEINDGFWFEGFFD